MKKIILEVNYDLSVVASILLAISILINKACQFGWRFKSSGVKFDLYPVYIICASYLCRYHAIHKDIYKWFNISFDEFGRTSTPQQTEICQAIFTKLFKNSWISENTMQQVHYHILLSPCAYSYLSLPFSVMDKVHFIVKVWHIIFNSVNVLMFTNTAILWHLPTLLSWPVCWGYLSKARLQLWLCSGRSMRKVWKAIESSWTEES